MIKLNGKTETILWCNTYAAAAAALVSMVGIAASNAPTPAMVADVAVTALRVRVPPVASAYESDEFEVGDED